MDSQHLYRLKEEQERAIAQTDSQISQLQQFKTDYQALQSTLTTLPDKLTHDVMVPFGKLAFMPGQLVRTNEVLVLLGDNWFAERSAKQAVDIAGRRIKELDSKLASLLEQKKLLEPRLGFTSNIQAELEGDVKEIVEEFDEEKEKLWDEQHRKNLKRSRSLKKMKNEDSSSKKEEKFKDSDALLWSRLDELEKLEEERGELDDSSYEIENREAGTDSPQSAAKPNNHRNLSERRVSWADKPSSRLNPEQQDTDDDNDDDDDDETDDTDEEESEENIESVHNLITFTHTPGPVILPHQVCNSGDSAIQSPSDIYKLFSPTPILKKSGDGDFKTTRLDSKLSEESRERNVVFPEEKGDLHNERLPSQPEVPLKSSSVEKAFTGLVVENPSASSNWFSSNKTEPASQEEKSGQAHAQGQPAKRVSKFKASRMKTNQS